METNFARNYDVSSAESAAVIGAVAMFLILFTIASYALGAFLLGRVFKKAGIPQWVAWVPVYNTWKLLEIGNQRGFWAIVGLVPFIGIIALIYLYIAMYHVGKKLGKEGWFVLLAIFIPIAWMIWLGFDDSKWPTEKRRAKLVKKSDVPTKS